MSPGLDLGSNSWLLNTSVFTVVILIGLEILTWVVTMLFSRAEQIPVKGKHLDKLEFIDNAFILTNKLITCCFVAHLCHVSHLPLLISSLSLTDVALSLMNCHSRRCNRL